MKFLGLLMIVACFSLCGYTQSARLTEKLRLLEESYALLQRIRRELMMTHAPCQRILEQLQKKQNSPLIERCLALCHCMAFPIAWTTAVKETGKILSEEQQEILTSVGAILGGSDLRHQEEALLQCEKQLRQLIKAGKEHCITQGKLYCSLGVLTGLLAAVILL